MKTILIAAMLVATWIARTTAGALLADRLRLRLPIVGPLLHKAITARVARMLATLLRSGVEIVKAIDAVRPVAGSPLYANALGGVDVAVREGETLSGALAQAGLFELLLAHLGCGRLDEGHDAGAQPQTVNFADYLLPGATDMPPIHILHSQTPSPLNPLGMKGAGEGGTIPAIAAIIAAVENALAPFGIKINEAPISPARIAELVRKAR